MGTCPGLPSISQQGLNAVRPFIPHIRQLVFHCASGARPGQPCGCARTRQTAVFLPLVCAMKFVQTRALSDSGRKWSNTLLVCFMSVTLPAVRNVSMARRISGGRLVGGGEKVTGGPGTE